MNWLYTVIKLYYCYLASRLTSCAVLKAMESSLNYKPERVGPVEVDDLKKDLFTELSKIPVSQESVLMEKEHLQVYLRIRPFTSTESDFSESRNCISVERPDTVVLKAMRCSLPARQSEKLGPQLAQRFQFSKVYGPETTQRQIFEGTTKALVKGVLGGENSLVFTYGVTNAGKTFTFLGPESDGGILPRSLNLIFNSIERQIYPQNNIKPHRCMDFTRLTKDQQDEEATVKKNLLRRFKENELQKSTSSMSSSVCSSLLEGSSCSESDGDSLCLEDDQNVKFSVWVSFCEIYNENIHDLLDFVSNGSQKRSVLRLCQDVKGNTFVKDLTWVQVNSAAEAYKVLKIGRKNQSFSATKLNSVSSRSHSIFSIRILRIEDLPVPRVQTISELSLCDLAGSERCAKTQNRGERLKEAGNINTSLLTLGKCINALRLNQTQSKFQQHIPFRESKLTHYLQGFFSGRGKACMIVNINQCASMYDETLNVLKFSAVAQKVVVLNPKPLFTVMPKKSARDVSIMINNVGRRDWTRRSTLIGWESSLEDVQEDQDDEDMEEEEEEDEEEEEISDDESMVENTVLEAGDQELCELRETIRELKEELSKEQSEKVAMESRIREEVTTEFMELFSNMEKDYNERLQREREIAEERAERRLEILKNLVHNSSGEPTETSTAEDSNKEDNMVFLDGMIEAMHSDLASIKSDAEAVQTCLQSGVDSNSSVPVNILRTQLDEMAEELLKRQQLVDHKNKELEEMDVELQKSKVHLLQAKKDHEIQTLSFQELCQKKDEMIAKLQNALDRSLEAAAEDRAYDDANKDKKDQQIQQLLQTLKEKEGQYNELEQEQHSLKRKVKELSDNLFEQTRSRSAATSSLESERETAAQLAKENRALASELSTLRQEAGDLRSELRNTESELSSQTAVAVKLSAKLQTAESQIRDRNDQQSSVVQALKQEIESLQRKLEERDLSQGQQERSAFQETIEALRKECKAVVSASVEKNGRIKTLEQELKQGEEEIFRMRELCDRLTGEREAERKENRDVLDRYEAEKLAAERLKGRCSQLQAELDALKWQLAGLEEREKASSLNSERASELEVKLVKKEDQRSALEERLQQTQNELDRVEDVLRKERCRASEEKENQSGEVSKARDEAERRRREMEEELARKDEELQTQAQEAVETKQQVKGSLDKIRSLSLDLQQKDKLISDLNGQLSEGHVEMEELKKKIASLTDEIRILRQKLCDSEKQRDEVLANQEQTVEPLKTEQASKARSLRNLQETCQDQQRKQTQTEQEQVLESRLNQIESLSEEHLKLKEKGQREGAPEPGPDRSHQEENGGCQKTGNTSERKLDGGGGSHGATQRPENDQVAAELRDETLCKAQLETDSSVVSAESQSDQRFPKPEVKISFSPPLKPKRLNLHRTGDEKSVTVKSRRNARKRKSAEETDYSIISTESQSDQRFPKPEVEISFSPLKPDRLNIRRPGDEESVTVKTRRAARKRKSAEMTSVESENRKNMRLRGNTRANIQSPAVLAKKANQLNQQDSPVSLKGRKDGTLQKIGDFIQSSPALLGSKAKKLMAKVAVKSPEAQNATETESKPKRPKRKLFKTQISSPLHLTSQLIIGSDVDDKESDHLIMKRKLRTKTAKR